MLPLSLPSVHLWCFTEFCWSLTQLPFMHNSQGDCNLVKGIAIWGVRLPDVIGDGIAEIFWQPTLSSPACVTWCRVLLPDVESCSSPHLLIKVLVIGLCVGSEVVWEDEWKHKNSPLLVTSPNIIIWTGCLVFINMNISPHIDTQILWNLCIRASEENAQWYSNLFPNIWRSGLHQGARFLADSAQLTLVCCTVDKTKPNKAHVKLIIQDVCCTVDKTWTK